jgi:histidyl-tRNA synthetase
MNQNALTFPFKRYQIQPVWRADRPQKGRYREFYQCDADVVGTDSLLCEAENIMMITEVFHQLGIVDYVIRLNHRRVLSGIAEKIGATGKEGAFCVAIDKLDKIGKDKVLEELAESGFDTAACQKLEPLLDAGKDNPVDNVAQFLAGSEQGQLGLQELNQIFTYLEAFKADTSKVQFDMTLARGLSYYTGAIFEVKSLGASLSSSLSGGGRYDNLTGVFGLEGVSGVGFSFGVDRIYDVMEELELFPQSDLLSTQVMITNFDAESEMHCLPLLADLRAAGIASELYPEQAKLKKQFNYADKKGIPYVLVAGTEELKSEKYGLKRMRDGHQENLNLPEIIELLSRR